MSFLHGSTEYWYVAKKQHIFFYAFTFFFVAHPFTRDYIIFSALFSLYQYILFIYTSEFMFLKIMRLVRSRVGRISKQGSPLVYEVQFVCNSFYKRFSFFLEVKLRLLLLLSKILLLLLSLLSLHRNSIFERGVPLLRVLSLSVFQGGAPVMDAIR